jgi:ribulose-5-phosphate 4-epimerase/fuculose-1-phosphate aldolase
VLYGWHEFRSLPSFETPIHLAACALSIAQGIATPATLHAHTHHLIALGRHQRIAGSFGKLNAAAYTAADGLYRLHDGLIGVVPYLLTGTEAHFDACLEPMRQHQVVLWMNHGILIRAPSVARAYALLGLVEESAEAALWSLEGGALRLPDADVRPFLERHELADAYDHLFG